MDWNLTRLSGWSSVMPAAQLPSAASRSLEVLITRDGTPLNISSVAPRTVMRFVSDEWDLTVASEAHQQCFDDHV